MVDGMKIVLMLCAGFAPVGAVLAEMSDPTRPPPGYSEQELAGHPESASQAPALAVSSLFLMSDKPYALVDGQIVRPGDPLADGKVSRIDAEGVWLRTPGAASLRLLKWLPDVVKTPLRTPSRAPLNIPHAPPRKEKK